MYILFCLHIADPSNRIISYSQGPQWQFMHYEGNKVAKAAN